MNPHKLIRRGMFSAAMLSLAALSLAPVTAQAATYTRQNNTNLLDTTAAWGGTSPTGADIAKWDSTCAGNVGTALGGNVTWGQILITNNVGSAVTIANTPATVLTLNGVSGTGIDMSDAAKDLTINNNVALGANQTWNVGVSRTLAIGDYPVSDGGNSYGITKVGSGTLILSGTNTFRGKTTINGGTLSINSITSVSGDASALGAPITVANGTIAIGSSTAAGTLKYTGIGHTSDRVINLSGSTQGATLNASGTGALVLTSDLTATGAGSKTLILAGTSTATNTLSGAIVDNSVTFTTSLTKSGIGTWVLSGTNTFTGATTFSGGGTLVLDYSTQSNSKINPAGVLTLSGGTLALTGGSFTQSVAATTLSPGGTFITRPSGASTLNLNAMTLGSGGNRGGSLSFSADNIATTDDINNNGILGGYAVVGTNWAVNSTGSGDGPIIALASYTALPASGSLTTINYSLTGSQNQTGATAVNSLKIIASADNQTLSIGAFTLKPTTVSNASGILYTGGASTQYTYNITGSGTISASNPNSDMFYHIYDGTLNVTAFANNGSGHLVKSGNGTLILGANNTYGGYTYVSQGTLRLTHANGAGSTGPINVQYLATLELANNITVGAKDLNITGFGSVSGNGELRNVSGINTYSGAITVGGGGAFVNSDSGTLKLTGGIVTSRGQNLIFGGAGSTVVSNSVVAGAGNIIKEGAGTLDVVVSNNTNQWTCGDMAVNAGTMKFTFDVQPSASLPVIRVAGDLTFNGAVTMSIALDNDYFTVGEIFPLLIVSGNAPTTRPTIVGFGGWLEWGGPDKKTLFLNTGIRGMNLVIR